MTIQNPKIGGGDPNSGWLGFEMVTVGFDTNDFELDPTKIPPGGVVQNCRGSAVFPDHEVNVGW